MACEGSGYDGPKRKGVMLSGAWRHELCRWSETRVVVLLVPILMLLAAGIARGITGVGRASRADAEDVTPRSPDP